MLDAFVERQTRTVRGNNVLIGLRLLLATVSLTVLVIYEFDMLRRVQPGQYIEPPLYLRPSGLVAIIVCALTILYILIARQTQRNPQLAPKLAFLQIFVDIFLISALVWNTGAVDSQFVVLYLIAICSAAFVLKWNVAILAAATAATLFSLATLLYSIDIMPSIFKQTAAVAQIARLRNLELLDFVRLLLLPVCAFFLTGVLAGNLSRRLAVARLLHDEILEGIGEGLLVVDVDCRTLYHNSEFKRLLGLQHALQQVPLEAVLNSNIERIARTVLSTGEPQRTEMAHKRADGVMIPLAVRLTPVSDPDSHLLRGLIIVLDDITAEKKMEEFMKHRQRIETMGHISATIAHEIRNPLASIRGAVQEIGRAVTIPESKRVLIEIVMSESDRLDQIITDFLKFARMRGPKLVSTDLGRLLMEVKLLLSSRPEAKDCAITVSGDVGPPFPADAEQLRQIFLNLGLNALQAMEGRARRELSFRVWFVALHRAQGFPLEDVISRGDHPGVVIEIQDTGTGIPKTMLTQVFEPFYTTKTAGTGLGLAIVERIVQSHDGIITLESKEGLGTTFRLWLPTDLKVGATISGMRSAVV